MLLQYVEAAGITVKVLVGWGLFFFPLALHAQVTHSARGSVPPRFPEHDEKVVLLKVLGFLLLTAYGSGDDCTRFGFAFCLHQSAIVRVDSVTTGGLLARPLLFVPSTIQYITWAVGVECWLYALLLMWVCTVLGDFTR